MQIYSSSSVTARSLGHVDNAKQVNDLRDRLAVQQEEQKTQSEQSKKVNQSRFDADEQAIAFVEQQQALIANQQNERGNQNASNTGYDQPSQFNQTAVNSYQSVDSITQRESIQQAFGVDLYA